jgi:hypothetical protein
MTLAPVPPQSVLLISLDSCRFDTFQRAQIPHLKRVGPLHKAIAPSYFTYGSHAAFWMGFTPGVTGSRTPWLNPKLGKLFRMAKDANRDNPGPDHFVLQGRSIVAGFRALGYYTLGSGAVQWFDPAIETSQLLTQDFEDFWYANATWNLTEQLHWIAAQLHDNAGDRPVFTFLNIGETHVPYWHQGASWEPWPSPCTPFGGPHASARQSRLRQRRCLEWIDQQLPALLQAFAEATIVICADHGDCWGEQGLWEHGISHAKTLTVPLILRVDGQPVAEIQARRRVLQRR